MPTTSTLGLAWQALVTAIDTGALAGRVFYAWPGPQAAQQNYEVAWVNGAVKDWAQEIPTIKAGRKQRQETYTLEVIIWVAKPELTSETAKTVVDRALLLADVVDDALANDVQVGELNVQWAMLAKREMDLVPYESGWGAQIVLSVEAHARLT